MTEIVTHDEHGQVVSATPVGMSIETIRQAIYTASELRMSRIDKEAPLSAQVEGVQSYLIETAIARSDLERARLYAFDALGVLRDQWDEIPRDSYVQYLNGSRTTNVQTETAKAIVEPDLAQNLRTVKRLIDRLTDQIKRLELDDKMASRVYTMLTGG